MTQVAKALGVSTSNLLQRVKAEPVQGKAYDKPEDTALVRRIEAVIKERTTKTHDGKIITLKNDLRWCSDALEFRCGNGDKVYVVFSLDCCDRETIRGVAKTPSFDGQDIRDLMAQSVEERFDATTDPAQNPVALRQRASFHGA